MTITTINTAKNCIKIVLAGVLILGFINPINAETDNYKTRYTPEGRMSVGATGTYSSDPHVWVYTSAFAKRFGMPQEWIDDKLKGAEAIAYRVDWDVYGARCGYFSEVENCRPTSACVLDIYIDDSADLPWNTKYRFEGDYGRKSHGFFVAQDKTDKPAYAYRTTRRGSQFQLGLDRLHIMHYKNYQSSAGNYSLFEYDRDIYKNLDYISGSVYCYFGNHRNVKIDVENAHFLKSGTINYNIKDTAHSIYIPDSFMQKIEDYNKPNLEPYSLFNELKKRLGSKQDNK